MRIDDARQALRDALAELEDEIGRVHAALAALNDDPAHDYTAPKAPKVLTKGIELPRPAARRVTSKPAAGAAKCALCGRTFANAHGVQVHQARSHKATALIAAALHSEARASVALDGQTQSVERVASKNPRTALRCQDCGYTTVGVDRHAINKHTFGEHQRMSKPAERVPVVVE